MAEVVRTLLQIAKAAKKLLGNFWLRLVGEATGGAKVQVTGHRSGHRSGHRPQVRSPFTHKNNRTLDKTVLY